MHRYQGRQELLRAPGLFPLQLFGQDAPRPLVYALIQQKHCIQGRNDVPS
jgi:hypothetical protein